jgi:lipopolysaccharide export system protein LptA
MHTTLKAVRVNYFKSTLLLLILVLSLALPAFAQQPQKKEVIQLEHADKMHGTKVNGQQVNYFVGNARFKHKDAILYCDSAIQYDYKNAIEAYGNIRIVQADTITLTGDRMNYNGNTRKAEVRGRQVVLVDRKMTLTTQYLDMELAKNLAYYFNGGTIVDEKNTLTSKQGYYDTKKKYFYFKKDVTLDSRDPVFALTSDTLEYSTVYEIAYFKGPTRIVSEGRILTANDGEYNTREARSKFRGRASIDSESYTLTADTLVYDEKNRIGKGRSNVVLLAKRDSLIVEGDYGDYRGAEGFTKVYGNALLKNIDGKDTLFIAADTLISLDSKDITKKKLLAYHNIRVMRNELRGRCDSLVYNFGDSTIHFFRNPILWSEGSQMIADSIYMQMAFNKIDKLYMNVNSFIISQDTLKNHNQVKGRNMVAFFQDSRIMKVDVNGNGQSLYFATEGDTTLMGMNKVLCSNMTIKFKENKVYDILFMKKPDATFIPPHELKDPDKKLKDFAWRYSERPEKKDVTRVPKVWEVPKQKKRVQAVKGKGNAKADKSVKSSAK